MPYIPGLRPSEPGPLSRFIPPLEEGVAAAWLARQQVPPSSWLLDPFGFAPRLALEAARSGYRVLVTANNPISRFLLEMAAQAPAANEFKAALADLAVSKKGSERLETHIHSLYLTSCEQCEREIQADAFLWHKEGDAPYARIYACPHCGDAGERPVKPADIERAREIAAGDGLHRSRALERIASLHDEDRVYAEEAIKHYLPRPLYVLTTLINRIEGLNLSPPRRRALTALLLTICDAGNTLWSHPSERPRPKQLIIPGQFRENNLWQILESGMEMWTETGASAPFVIWPNRLPESGGICMFEGRLSQLARQLKKEIPIAAVLACMPRPNQAFWTLCALWAGWLWGREAVEPYKTALRRRRYDWAWNATALHASFTHLFELLPLGTPVFGLLAEPEPPFLTSTLTAALAAGYDLKALALRTEHDPIQIVWERGEQLQRQTSAPDLEAARAAILTHLAQRGEPASYLHVHAAALIALAEQRALIHKDQDFDEALRTTHSVIQAALSGGATFEHHSSGESYETGLWGLSEGQGATTPGSIDSLADSVEVAIVAYLQKNQACIYLELEADLYPRFPGLLTPSQGMIYAVLDSYARKEGSLWHLRPEDEAQARRRAMEGITAAIESIGSRLGYAVRREDKYLLWEEKKKPIRAFCVLASALVGRAIAESVYHPDQAVIVIPGGRAALAAYKAQRDPALARLLQPYLLVKYRMLRAIADIPILTRESFEEQLTSDPIEKARGQLMMF